MAAPLIKTSVAWKYFDENEISFAECKLCKAKPATSDTKSISVNTINLVKHLSKKSCHTGKEETPPDNFMENSTLDGEIENHQSDGIANSTGTC